MAQFSAIITPTSVSFTGPDGRVHNVLASEGDNFVAVCEAIKELQAAIKSGVSEDEASALHQAIADILVAKINLINNAGEGKVSVRDGVVYYIDEPVHSALAERILWGLDQGFDMLPYMRFLDNCMENPSNQAIAEMYTFIENAKMGITDDGHILAYKKVGEDYKDIYSKTMDNSVGQIVEMRRNLVNEDRTQTCSSGLHFCSMSYLPSYGTGRGDRVVIVKVNPRDVVSVPIDYNFAKARCCRYEVVDEYTGDNLEDLLGTKAVWSDDDWTTDDQDDFDPDIESLDDDTEGLDDDTESLDDDWTMQSGC